MTLPKFTVAVLSVFCVHWISFCAADSSEYVDFRASPPTEYGPSSSLSPAVTSFSSPSSSNKPKNYHYNSYGRDNKGVYVDERRPRHHMIPFTPSFILRTPAEPTAKPKLESHFEPYEAFDFNFNNRPRSRSRRPHHFNNRKRPSHGHKKSPPPKRFPPSQAKEASTDDPIIFSFKVDRRSWSQNYKIRLASLQHKISSLEEMESYAKPSTMQLGYKLWNWVKGFGSKKDSGSSSSTTLEKLEEPEKGSKYDKYENPTYYSHSVSSTEIIRGGRDRNRFKNLPIPPVAFNSLRGHDHDHHPHHNPHHNPHHHHHHHHHHGDEDSYRHDPYYHSKESDIPLSADVHDDFHSSKETRHNKNPQCSKGGSMIFCNSAALTGLLELLEAHMGKTNKYDDSYYNKDNPSYTGTPYDEIGEPPIIEVIEMDPQEEHRDYDQFPDTEKYSYTKSGAVDFGYDSYNKGTSGYDDDIEIVIVVHTKKPSHGKDNNNYNYNQYGLGHGGGSSGWHSKTKTTHDKYKKPFRNLDDDEDLNEYDKKFDRLKKIVDIIRYKHNKDGEFNGDEYYYDDSNHKRWKGKYSRGNKDDDGYWDSLLEEFRLRHGYDFVPRSSKYSKMTSRKGASTSIENQMLGMGLVIDMKDHGRGNSLADRLMMGRMGKMEEKYFGLSRAGKSKHASAEERTKAIKAKLAQVHP